MIYGESAMSKNSHGHQLTINFPFLLGLVMVISIPLNLKLLAYGQIISNELPNNINFLRGGAGGWNGGTHSKNLLLVSEIGAIEIPVPPPETSTITKYRVLVATNNPKDGELVRVLFPDAFSTVYNGQSMLQVGLFNSQEKAVEALESLKLNGFYGVIVNEPR